MCVVVHCIVLCGISHFVLWYIALFVVVHCIKYVVLQVCFVVHFIVLCGGFIVCIVLCGMLALNCAMWCIA